MQCTADVDTVDMRLSGCGFVSGHHAMANLQQLAMNRRQLAMCPTLEDVVTAVGNAVILDDEPTVRHRPKPAAPPPALLVLSA